MKTILVFSLIFFIGSLNLSAQVNSLNKSRSIMLTKNSDKYSNRSIKQNKNIKVNLLSTDQSIKGYYHILDDNQIAIKGTNIPINDISSISKQIETASVVGWVLMATGSLVMLISSKKCETSTNPSPGFSPYGGGCKQKDRDKAFVVGAELTGIGLGLQFVKRKYDVKNSWSISIQ